MRLLVIGKTGQLSRCLQDAAKERRDIELVALGRDECNLTDYDSVCLAAAQSPPWNAIINTAAYHGPDCESNLDAAWALNVGGVQNLRRATGTNTHIYHLSTDYVFGGLGFRSYGVPQMKVTPTERGIGATGHRPYEAFDQPNPQTNYGRTKYTGELVARLSKRATVIRTASLFSKYGSTGKGGSNFLLQMLHRAMNREYLLRPDQVVTFVNEPSEEDIAKLRGLSYTKELLPIEVVDDVVMSPTYTPWLARAILELVVKESKPEIIHMVCDGPPVSWFGFAKAIFEVGGFHEALERLVPTQCPEDDRRPRYSALAHGSDHIRLGDWHSALEHFFAWDYKEEP